MRPRNNRVNQFTLRDCTLIAIATGRRAQNLRELRDGLGVVHQESIYYHFWGGLLHPRFDDPEFNNDFAAWVGEDLHEPRLAERLGVIDPTEHHNLEELRQELIDVIENRLDESDYVPWAKADKRFHFIRSKIVVFDTHHAIKEPRMLVPAAESMSLSSVFYHFIDARRRTPDRVDDFSTWLLGFGDDYESLRQQIVTIDPFFVTLAELRDKLRSLFDSYFGDGHGKQ
jgi:hypothetical protein